MGFIEFKYYINKTVSHFFIFPKMTTSLCCLYFFCIFDISVTIAFNVVIMLPALSNELFSCFVDCALRNV